MNEELKRLLKDLHDRVDTLSTDEYLLLMELFVKNKLLKNTNRPTNKYSDKDMMNYAIMGYYIYNYIIDPQTPIDNP